MLARLRQRCPLPLRHGVRSGRLACSCPPRRRAPALSLAHLPTNVVDASSRRLEAFLCKLLALCHRLRHRSRCTRLGLKHRRLGLSGCRPRSRCRCALRSLGASTLRSPPCRLCTCRVACSCLFGRMHVGHLALQIRVQSLQLALRTLGMRSWRWAPTLIAAVITARPSPTCASVCTRSSPCCPHGRRSGGCLGRVRCRRYRALIRAHVDVSVRRLRQR